MADVSANNGQVDAKLSDAEEDTGDSTPPYTKKEEVQSTLVPYNTVILSIRSEQDGTGVTIVRDPSDRGTQPDVTRAESYLYLHST